MAVFGWIVLVWFMVFASMGYGIVAWDGLGTYNIGGVPNKVKQKVLIVVVGIALAFLWAVVFWISPFRIVLLA